VAALRLRSPRPWRALGGMLFSVASLSACAQASRESSKPPHPPVASVVAPVSASSAVRPVAESDAQQHVAEMLGRVAKARHLAPQAPVAARVLDRAALIASVREHVSREVPPDIIRNQGELLAGLGLIPPDFNYEEGAFRLLQAQLAGFYEPRDKKMYLAADLDDRSREATLAHELVHALQDQHYDLGRSLSYQAQANDRESALQALAEGDATSAMMDLLLGPSQRSAIDVGDDVFAAEVEGSMGSSPESAGVPRVLRASLVAPYVDGVLFVHALRRRGIARGATDGGWSAVDAAWRSPPATTEQLLHLDKYDAHEPAEELTAPSAPAGAPWKAVYDDVFGEEGLRIAVEEWLPRKAAAVAADGWAGDRAVLYRQSAAGDAGTLDDESTFAIAWRIRFDAGSGDAKDAESAKAFRAIAVGLRPGQPAPPKSVCLEREALGPLVLLRSGRDIVFAAGPYRREGTRVSSRAHCAETLRWAGEMLAQSKP
jgi:hypothetical protein